MFLVYSPEKGHAVDDERSPYYVVKRVLLEADVRREKRRQVVDSMAASLILQGYLDYRNAGGIPR